MKTYEIITLVIAIWGALISTILAIREILRENKKISIYLYYIEFEERYKISIVNTGTRPFELTDISLSINWSGKGEYDPIPIGSRFDEIVNFPQIIEAGHSVSYYLSSVYYEALSNNGILSVEVFDSEGNVYNKYSKNYHNIKYGYMMNQEQIENFKKKAKKFNK